jgi:S-adenosylmethionine synthetase
MIYEFTSESVSIGHPDKVADLISDTVATYLIDKNINHRAAIETLVTTNMVTVAGEYKSNKFDKDVIENLVRQTVKDIGYEQDGFHWEKLKVYNELHGQSPDIALGTDNFGAGDQGIMFGYACDETPNYMPSAIYYSHEILKALEKARRNGADWLGPDSKAQITFNYDGVGIPVDIKTVVCSTQHSDDLTIEEVRDRVIDIILPVIKDKVDLIKTKWHINPTGKFVIGGPDGDTGLTGRKIIVDTYGGYCPHGGGAFSGKDCTKVDRSAAYMARYLAKNVVASGKAKNCTVQLSYAIGVKEPTSIYVYADGVVRKEISDYFRENLDLTPLGIINKFNLFGLDLTETTNYGHFGKEHLPWEQTDPDLK